MNGGIGIDVSKATLDVAVHATGETRSVANTAAGWRALARWLLPLQPRQVVLEATGALMLRESAAPSGPVLWLNHDIIARQLNQIHA